MARLATAEASFLKRLAPSSSAGRLFSDFDSADSNKASIDAQGEDVGSRSAPAGSLDSEADRGLSLGRALSVVPRKIGKHVVLPEESESLNSA